jgi:uncharacterized protein YnzC (UPF0291/DUF896 family)
MGRKKVQQAIEDRFSTLYYNKLRGYQHVDERILGEMVSSLDRKVKNEEMSAKEREELAHYLQDNVAQFKRFSHEPVSRQLEVADIARKRDITPQRAYELNDASQS